MTNFWFCSTHRWRRTAMALACWLSATLSAWAQATTPFQVIPASTTLLQALQDGGYVLYMRHGNTNNSVADQPRVDLANCRTQRPLNDEGRQVARLVGRAIEQAKIPVSEVHSSPMCRARETATLAFGTRVRVDLNLMYTANLTAQEKQPILAQTRHLLSQPVAAGGNRVIVAHAPNLADLIGYFVKPEGTVVVFRPLGAQGFQYLGSIHPADWSTLLP